MRPIEIVGVVLAVCVTGILIGLASLDIARVEPYKAPEPSPVPIVREAYTQEWLANHSD